MELGEILELGGLIGGLICLTGYIPQVSHLVKVKDSTGMSSFAWAVWMLGSLLLLIYAIYIQNRLYVVVEILFLIANLFIIILIYKYRRKVDSN